MMLWSTPLYTDLCSTMSLQCVVMFTDSSLIWWSCSKLADHRRRPAISFSETTLTVATSVLRWWRVRSSTLCQIWSFCFMAVALAALILMHSVRPIAIDDPAVCLSVLCVTRLCPAKIGRMFGVRTLGAQQTLLEGPNPHCKVAGEWGQNVSQIFAQKRRADRISILFVLETLGGPWHIELDGGLDTATRWGGGRGDWNLEDWRRTKLLGWTTTDWTVTDWNADDELNDRRYVRNISISSTNVLPAGLTST